MSDWPDIESPDDWEQNYWGPERPDGNEDKNARLVTLIGGYGENIDVIKWMPNVEPPQWAIWLEKITTDETP
jgi:hypothetical protein